MPLPDRMLTPFRITYRKVTYRIRGEINVLQPPYNEWLSELVERFWNEFRSWNRPGYDAYCAQFRRLDSRLLWLAAAAYLHIAYDLPRMIADVNSWARRALPALDMAVATHIYQRLNDVFQSVFEEISPNQKVTGFYSSIYKIAIYFGFPREAIQPLIHWVLHLRRASWLHSMTLGNLADQNERTRRENEMLQAMTLALGDVIDSRPWTAANKLQPTDDAVYQAAIIAIPAAIVADWASFGIGVAVAIAAILFGAGLLF